MSSENSSEAVELSSGKSMMKSVVGDLKRETGNCIREAFSKRGLQRDYALSYECGASGLIEYHPDAKKAHYSLAFSTRFLRLERLWRIETGGLASGLFSGFASAPSDAACALRSAGPFSAEGFRALEAF